MGRGKYRTSLAHLLIEKVKVGEITAYDETPENYFTEVLSPDEIKKMLSRVDSIPDTIGKQEKILLHMIPLILLLQMPDLFMF